MRIGKAAVAAIFVILTASGCASMSADECAMGDWHAIGFEDGAQGFKAERLGQHRKACAKHSVAPDFVAYRNGRDEGLREFCQPSRGFTFGANGGVYGGVCAADQEGHFLDAYRHGRHLHALRSSVSTTNQAIESRHHELDDVEQQIRDTEAALISSESSAEERVILLADLKSLSEQTGRLEAEILALHEERVGYERELESYQAVLADSGY
ncbi:MAG: DUF2799 domain-containing protein [Woeseia sp.]|nr:DUF2799 domain-containing protein [Woeseia sp.]MBT8095766.1 DUF2799 domain-containing protein [Woeseia sp.]NNE60237.1 DUF2799 domain-containing protein [Woeseia sp.]NNL55146.1 DUF2799 domain-containing protein [Woeseia sp.]